MEFNRKGPSKMARAWFEGLKQEAWSPNKKFKFSDPETTAAMNVAEIIKLEEMKSLEREQQQQRRRSEIEAEFIRALNELQPESNVVEDPVPEVSVNVKPPRQDLEGREMADTLVSWTPWPGYQDQILDIEKAMDEIHNGVNNTAWSHPGTKIEGEPQVKEEIIMAENLEENGLEQINLLQNAEVVVEQGPGESPLVDQLLEPMINDLLAEPGPPVQLVEVKSEPGLDVFTEVEDLITHALDTISPCDAKFISDHMVKRQQAQIEKRLNQMDFRKLSFTFGKLPILIFEVLLVNETTLGRKSLMLLTEKQLVSLRCKRDLCTHGPGIAQARLVYLPQSRLGVDTSQLCQFIASNTPSKYVEALGMNRGRLEHLMEESKINFHKRAISTFSRKDMKMMSQTSLTIASIKRTEVEPIKIDESGKVIMIGEHEDTLRRIVNALGKTRWEEVTNLLLASFNHEIDYDVEDAEIYSRIAGYYHLRLDRDLDMGGFSVDEDKCMIFMHKYWSITMVGDSLWNHISRHLPGRSPNQVKNRFLRIPQSDQDLCLENIRKFPFDPTIPAVFENDNAHALHLTVIPRGVGKEVDITTKLQTESRFLVLGTYKQIFLLPCKETGIRCTHQDLVTNGFTYDSSRLVLYITFSLPVNRDAKKWRRRLF